MSGITKRVHSNRRNVDIGGGVDKAGLPGSVGIPTMLKRFVQIRAPNSVRNSPKQENVNGSLYFDGTASSRILIDNGEDLELDGDFTIEWFQYQMNTKGLTGPRIFQIGNFPNPEIGFSIEENGMIMWIKNYDWPNDGVAGASFFGNVSDVTGENLPYDKWMHFAIVKEYNDENQDHNIRLYLNGKLAPNVLDNVPATINISSNTKLCIGNETNPVNINTPFEGYITNFRWTKGQALYTGDQNNTANFQVPTSPLTALPSTKLLFLAQNNAPYANGKDAVTTVSNITWSPKSPFN